MTASGLLRPVPRWSHATGDGLVDVAIRVAVVAVLVLAAYVGFSYWSVSQARVEAPAEADVTAAEAIAGYKAILKRNPADVSALSGLANAEMAAKDFKSAESHWRKAIAVVGAASAEVADPRLEVAYYGLGVACLEMHRYQDALVALSESARMKNDASDTHYMLSVAYRGLARPDKQRAELSATVRLDPENAQAQYDLGLLALKQGDVASAAELLRVAADYAPATIQLPKLELDKIAAAGGAAERLAKARALAATDVMAALGEARTAAALDPTDSGAVRLVANLWDRRGDRDRALNAYRRLDELRPGDAEAARAIKRLGTDGK